MLVIHRMLRFLFCLTAAVLGLALPAACRADDTSVIGVGGAVQLLRHHPTIRMVEEEVTITHLADPRVRARFVFHNEGPATDVLIGFPELSGGASAIAQNARLSNFRSFVDGKPVQVTRRPDKSRPGGDSEEYADWLVKRVHFGAHQTRIIVDQYTGGGANQAMGDNICMYVLTTGASWKGTIGRALITADLNSISYGSVTGIEPAGYKIVAGKAVWDLRNFKPTDDINITWFPTFVDVAINGKFPCFGGNTHPPDTPGDWIMDQSLSQVFWPVRRHGDIWLPAKTAAAWLNARYAVEKPGQVVRLEKGSHWVEARVGSRVLTCSDGTTFLMNEPAEYPHDPNSQVHAMTMVDFIPLVRAFGGTAEFTRAGAHLSVRVSDPNAPRQPQY